MILEFIVAIVAWLSYGYFIYLFFGTSSVAINLILFILLYILIRRDLKDHDHVKYYLAAIVLTALFFLFSTSSWISAVITAFATIDINLISVAGLLTYFFARVVAAVYELGIAANERRKEKKK